MSTLFLSYSSLEKMLYLTSMNVVKNGHSVTKTEMELLANW